jgi:hypothetical protein
MVRTILAVLFSCLLAAASPAPKEVNLERDVWAPSENFTLMSRSEFLEKRQPGGVSISSSATPLTDKRWELTHALPEI